MKLTKSALVKGRSAAFAAYLWCWTDDPGASDTAMTRSIATLAMAVACTISCTSQLRHVPASHPFEEIVVASDGTEASVRLAKGIAAASLVDLRPFGRFRPGITPDEARAEFGPPTRVERDDGKTRYVYATDNGPVWVGEWQELSSRDGSRVTRYGLSIPVQDPPFAATLHPSLRRLLADEKLLTYIAIASTEPGDPVVGLSVSGGLVSRIDIGLPGRKA